MGEEAWHKAGFAASSSLYEDLDDPYSPEWMEGVFSEDLPLWRTRESVSVASGSLLEEVGYPLGIRRFEKDLLPCPRPPGTLWLGSA